MRLAAILSLGTSVLLGTGALLVARVWMVPSAKPGAAAALSQAAPTTPVVLAKAELKYGDTVTADKLTVARLPVGAAPQGAFATIQQVVGQAGGPPVALAALSMREPILPTKISGPGMRNSVSAQIAPGMRAYSIKISDILGVGGHALPGDRVDVVMTREPDTKNPNADRHALISDVVVQDVRLLGVNLNVDPASNATAAQADPHTATLEVSLDDAQKLAVAGGVGTLSLALRRAGANEVAPARQVLVNDLSTGAVRSAPRSVTVRAIRRPAPAEPHASVVEIVQGDHSTSVSAPAEKRGGV